MKIVIDMGGSVLCPEGVPKPGYLRDFRKLVLGFAKDHKIVIVAGGGGLAKGMIARAEEAGAKDRDLRDLIGIAATRVNASILLSVIGDRAYSRVPQDTKEAAKALESCSIAVMGGIRPRQTTDAVAVQVAREIKADFIVVATNVKGVYTKNPLKYKDARFLKSVSPRELVRIVEPCDFRPGHSGVLDPVAARELVGGGIKTLVLDGRDLDSMKKALTGKEFIGTVIE